jgi:hypothetical protein
LPKQTRVVIGQESGALIVVGSDATTRQINKDDRPAQEALLEALQASRVQVWADDATALHRALKERTGMHLPGVQSVQVAELTLRPARGKNHKTLLPLSLAETCAAIEKIEAELSSKPHLRKWVDLDQDVDAIWREPAERGYLIDGEALARHQQRVSDARVLSRAYFGCDLLSDAAALEWMESARVVCLDRDKLPTCSIRDLPGADVPEDLRGADWPLFLMLRETAGLAKSLTNVYTNVSADGKVYPRINATGAVTGRMTITDPALQATPRYARNIYCAGPGRVLVGCDLARVEPTLVAALSGDPGLLRAVEGDIYAELAESVWGSEAKGDGALRDVAKVALNATNYGQGATGLARRLGCSREEAARIIWTWSHAYPVFAEWKRSVIAQSERVEPLTTHGGRPLPVLDAHYQAVAYVVQGSASDIFKQMTRAVAKELRKQGSVAELWLPIHDELVLSVPDDAASIAQAIDVLDRCMRITINGVTINGTPQALGQSWRKV